MNNENKKCIDCLYCKVSNVPTSNGRICYCSESKDKEGDTETFWLNKSVCKKFVDMGDDNHYQKFSEFSEAYTSDII